MLVPISRPPLARPADDVDVAIVGAGAAGIAAARFCLAEGLSVAVLEARDRVGGRAVTASFGGHPIDLGAHWLHAGDLNPLVRLAKRRGERLIRAPGGGPVVISGRVASPDKRRAQGLAFERADLAFNRAARGEADLSIAAALPSLGPWRHSTASTMALISGRPLAEVSLKDFPSEEFGDNYFIRGGYGDYVSRLAIGLPVELDCPVSSIDWSGSGVTVGTARGQVNARTVVVTAPMPVLDKGMLRFRPDLPGPTREAISGFLPGVYEHAILNWPSSPFRAPDRIAKLITSRASRGLLSRMDDSPFHYLELDYATVAAARGRDGLARLTRDFLREVVGGRAIRDLRVLTVTDWQAEPWSLAAWAVVPPGRAADRLTLSRPVGDRIWFAGEAVSRGMWGTVGGAWEEGERVGREILARLRPGRG